MKQTLTLFIFYIAFYAAAKAGCSCSQYIYLYKDGKQTSWDVTYHSAPDTVFVRLGSQDSIVLSAALNNSQCGQISYSVWFDGVKILDSVSSWGNSSIRYQLNASKVGLYQTDFSCLGSEPPLRFQVAYEGFNKKNPPVDDTLYGATFSPNPFHTSTILNAPKSWNDDFTFKIYSITGALMREEKLHGHTSLINRNSLEEGIYLYQIINQNGQMVFGKFIIQ